MRVLVTGGAGHIGSHIVERLLAKGDKVLVIDNYQTGRRDNLKEHVNLQIVEDSIANTNKVFEVFDAFQPEILVHAAASYKDPENWIEDATTNVVGAANLVKAAQKSRSKAHYLFSDSALLWIKTD